ncbi:MAG: asparagine synthase-related protein [Dehalococcoidia bacterium]
MAIPFYDLGVVEYQASTPDWVKRSGGHTKHQLREAIRRVLPSAIANRVNKAHYDEVFHRGLEMGSAPRAHAMIRTLPGLDNSAAMDEIDRRESVSFLRLAAVALHQRRGEARIIAGSAARVAWRSCSCLKFSRKGGCMRKPYTKPTLKTAGDLADVTRGSGAGWFDSITAWIRHGRAAVAALADPSSSETAPGQIARTHAEERGDQRRTRTGAARLTPGRLSPTEGTP